MTPAILIAAPRSGTTLIYDLFKQHPQVISWHEPYFIWEYLQKLKENDCLDDSDADPKSIAFIRRQFEYLAYKTGKCIVLEKTPTNAFKISYIHKVLPNAKWIHLYRDGRDVISSMKVQYQRRKQIAKKRSLKNIIFDIHYTLSRQPLLRFRLLAILYEMRHWHRIAPYFQFNMKNQWSTSIGWGPRYPGWQEDKQILDEIEFIATQWVKTEQQVLNDLKIVDQNKLFTFSYEQLLSNPVETLTDLCEFLEISSDIVGDLANQIRRSNTSKWKSGLTDDEIDRIKPIISDLQYHYNYQ